MNLFNCTNKTKVQHRQNVQCDKAWFEGKLELLSHNACQFIKALDSFHPDETKQGKKYGPWGDRHSEESVDFDVSAPPGQALAFFSGTIDFGVPLRSVSFHWKPIA